MLRLSGQYGEWDIRLKNRRSIFKSFRFEIVLYSILSLLYTIVTEVLIYCLAYYTKTLIQGLNIANSEGISLSQAIDHISNLPIQNGTSFLDGSSTTGLTHSLTSVLHVNRDYLLITLIIGIVVGMFLFVVYFLLLTRRFSNYLYEISDGIKVIAGGNFSTRIRVKNEDEFAVIAASINKMAGDISAMMENERRSEELKHELITNVAHDLRTPLTSIIGYLDLAKEDKADQEERTRYLSIAYDKSKRLENLIEDLFSYTKFTSGEVKVQKRKMDLVKFLEQMIEEFYPSFQDSGLEYELLVQSNRLEIDADGNLLARAVANLISNAVKYTKRGEKITIELEVYFNVVKIIITNYGTEISKKDLPYIFDKFYRVENSRSEATGGTGLGLAIAKSIIKMHNGELTATSEVENTKFIIELPYKS